MEFNTYGKQDNPKLLLIPGLGVSHEIFLPLVSLLQDRFYIISAGVDGFLVEKDSQFTSVDDQAAQAIQYIKEKLDGHLDAAYGLSLGGKILSRMLERNEITIDHAVLDAAPLLPLPKWSVNPLRYYQCLNVWTCVHWEKFWRFVFRSHYFGVLLDEINKVNSPSLSRSVLEGYKSVYTNKLESIHGADIHFWYGTLEAFVAKPQVEHLLKLCPDAKVTVFPKLNHGQLLVDQPEEVARRICEMTGISKE
ncbi:MAG: hypothetical protein IKY83_05375 [Proteobacteria bacterium]|nr:hypothetical protein [Pseudomonadota bacterium]